MNRGYIVNDRLPYTNKDNISNEKRFVIGQKENYEQQTYQASSKILEIKNKYKDKFMGENINEKQKNNNTITNNSGRGKENQMIRKLTNLKYQLQSMPNWEKYAKSILFSQQSFDYCQSKNDCEIKKKKEISGRAQKLQTSSAYENKDQIQEICSFNCSKVKGTIISTDKQSRKSEEKKESYRQEFVAYTPSKDSTMGNYYLPKSIHKIREANISLLNQSAANTTYLDSKINQIDKKIRQVQLKKKKLGVDFVPFSRQLSQKKTIIENKQRQRTPQPINSRPVTSIKKFDLQKTNHTKNIPSLVRIKQIEPSANKSLSHELTSPRFAIIEHKETTLSANQNSIIDKQQIVPRDKIICKKTEQGIKQRKKRMCSERICNENQLKKKKKETFKLVNAFCQQVKLDEKLRNIKLWFKFCKNQKKILKLRNLLRAEGFDFSVKKIEEEFEVQEKEDNPFFSVSSQDYDMESAAKSYAESEKHWKKNLSKRFNRQILEEEDLNNLALDLDKKGHIVLEDLVRFLNMETGTFFRNRDLITIFRRICGNNRKLTFNDFLKIICD